MHGQERSIFRKPDKLNQSSGFDKSTRQSHGPNAAARFHYNTRNLRNVVPEATSPNLVSPEAHAEWQLKELECASPEERATAWREALERVSPEERVALKEDIASKTREALERAMFEVVWRSEERRVGKECRSRWSADH